MNCPFCHYSNTNMILYKNSLTYIIPDFSPLALGHLLILPYKHIHGIANADDTTILDINRSISYVQDLYSDGQGMFFEHGAIMTSTAGSSVDHAHLHFLPILVDIKLLLAEQNFDLKKIIPIGSLSELQMFSIQRQPYIYWRYFNGDGFAYPVKRLKSQFLRTVIGKTINEFNDYNWHSDALTKRAKELVIQTIDDWNMRRERVGK